MISLLDIFNSLAYSYTRSFVKRVTPAKFPYKTRYFDCKPGVGHSHGNRVRTAACMAHLISIKDLRQRYMIKRALVAKFLF